MKRVSLNGIGGVVADFFTNFSRCKQAVGIDIGSYSTKVVVIKNGSGEAEFSAGTGEFFQDSGVFKDKE